MKNVQTKLLMEGLNSLFEDVYNIVDDTHKKTYSVSDSDISRLVNNDEAKLVADDADDEANDELRSQLNRLNADGSVLVKFANKIYKVHLDDETYELLHSKSTDSVKARVQAADPHDTRIGYDKSKQQALSHSTFPKGAHVKPSTYTNNKNYNATTDQSENEYADRSLTNKSSRLTKPQEEPGEHNSVSFDFPTITVKVKDGFGTFKLTEVNESVITDAAKRIPGNFYFTASNANQEKAPYGVPINGIVKIANTSLDPVLYSKPVTDEYGNPEASMSQYGYAMAYKLGNDVIIVVITDDKPVKSGKIKNMIENNTFKFSEVMPADTTLYRIKEKQETPEETETPEVQQATNDASANINDDEEFAAESASPESIANGILNGHISEEVAKAFIKANHLEDEFENSPLSNEAEFVIDYAKGITETTSHKDKLLLIESISLALGQINEASAPRKLIAMAAAALGILGSVANVTGTTDKIATSVNMAVSGAGTKATLYTDDKSTEKFRTVMKARGVNGVESAVIYKGGDGKKYIDAKYKKTGDAVDMTLGDSDSDMQVISVKELK